MLQTHFFNFNALQRGGYVESNEHGYQTTWYQDPEDKIWKILLMNAKT